MTLFTDEDCGIEAPHRHTGELVQGYFIEYWCPSVSGWMSKDELYGAKCQCTTQHMRARTQATVTEIIEILPIKLEWHSDDLRAYIWEELSKSMRKLFDEEFEKFLNGDSNVEPRICDTDVRDRIEDSPEGGVEG